MSNSKEERTISCIRKGPLANEHQMQLWIIGTNAEFHFEVRNVYAPNGTPLRQCVLASSQKLTDRETAVAEGNAAFDEQSKPTK